MRKLAVLVCLLVAEGTTARAWVAGPSCKPLAQLALPNAKVTSAQGVAAGTFAPPAGATPWLVGDPSFYKQLPAFCRGLRLPIDQDGYVTTGGEDRAGLRLPRWMWPSRWPAGGGLAGTGPKAGGPRYLHRFATERTVSTDTTAAGGNATLLSLQEEG